MKIRVEMVNVKRKKAEGIPLTSSVKTPPRSGPMTEDIPKTAPKSPVYKGRLCKGTVMVIIIMTPENTPADPRPAIALPMMKILEDGAAAHSRDPISNTITELRKTHLVL